MVKSNRMFEARGFLAGVFGIMRDLDISVDLVSTSEVSISFTVDDSAALAAARPRLEEFGETSIIGERAILALVGEGLKGLPGVAGQLFVALGKRGINIEMISQGITETNISCVLKEGDTAEALRVAHAAFFE
jgi:aspartate kinase